MFDWLKGKSKRPSNYELVSRVASTIDAFIDQDGLDEFAKGSLCVVIRSDYGVSISDARFARDALVAVPLSELKLETAAVLADPQMRLMAVDFAAGIAVKRLPA